MLKKQTGFSLMEVILAIGIISVIGVMASNLLTRTYRTSNDAELLSKLKQNGTVASNILSESIRMADSVVCYGPGSNPPYTVIAIRTFSGKYLRFRFIGPVTSGNKKNGYIAKQENLNPDDLAYFCSTAPNTTQEVIITDNNTDTGVSISKGEFKRLSGSVGKDTVTIIFDVNPAPNQAGAIAVVNIQTTVQVR